ncbi:MAG: hypothetical protein RMX96_04765 [Nostoc sp. ChiSLP02]|nr:hypothetical protein [Nostoc sp. DedSLP05]MDZ8102829.1 hypothetical protein [Nostoc sp. DedSLP01]MDZ8184161.1 hypothetical protein [Nostoc sp. ChiSLP02]
MRIQAWTFLISRNQSIDYKTIVAPDFISEAKIRSSLTKATEEDFLESGRISIREVKGSEVGNFTVVFRSVKARSKDIGEEGNEVLRDPFGREIYWVEGLVFRKNLPEIQYKVGETHLNQAHQELQDKYREFWYEDKLSISDVDWIELTSEPGNKSRVLEPLTIRLKPQLPEHRSSEEQKIKNSKYVLSKFGRNTTSLFKFVLITITGLLFLTGILWKVWSNSQLPSICLYKTQDVPIQFNRQNQNPSSPEVLFGIEKLKKLKQEHETAWIWLNGYLEVENDFANRIQNEVDKHKKIKGITIVRDEKIQSRLNINNHPIGLAIALLENKKVANGKLDATIIEPISQKASSCNL